MLCLRRTDQNKDLFKQAMYKSHESKRINFYNLVDLKNNTLICNGEGKYHAKDLMFYTLGGNYRCEFNNKDVVDIIESPIKSDFSFWYGEGRCLKDEDAHDLDGTYFEYPSAMLCDKTPTKEEAEEECNQIENGFYCEKSGKCISKGKCTLGHKFSNAELKGEKSNVAKFKTNGFI